MGQAGAKPERGASYADRVSRESLSVVMPALNEEELVGKAVESVRLGCSLSGGAEPEVIVVDGGSQDGTVAGRRELDPSLKAPPCFKL